MLRIAVPNKGSLSESAAQMLRECGYRQRRDPRELVLQDPDNDAEFFFLRPRDIAVYVGSGAVDVGITGRDLLLDSGADAEGRRRGGRPQGGEPVEHPRDEQAQDHQHHRVADAPTTEAGDRQHDGEHHEDQHLCAGEAPGELASAPGAEHRVGVLRHEVSLSPGLGITGGRRGCPSRGSPAHPGRTARP
jgi:hypothetical protein